MDTDGFQSLFLCVYRTFSSIYSYFTLSYNVLVFW